MNAVDMTTLEKIGEGKTNWEPTDEGTLDNLAREGYIRIIQQHRASTSGNPEIDAIFVSLTQKGRDFLDGK